MSISSQNINNLISNVVNQYIVTPANSSISFQGVAGFLFDILDDEQVMIDSEITDHFVEGNYAIQDHWAQRPIRFSLTGYVAELSQLFPRNGAVSTLGVIQNLASIVKFLPELSEQASQVFDQRMNTTNRIAGIFNLVENASEVIKRYSTTASKQQIAYQTFLNLWQARQLCNVETPYGIFRNMAIENIRATQKGITKLISDFSVSFKQIRVVQVVTSALPASPNPAGSGQVPAPIGTGPKGVVTSENGGFFTETSFTSGTSTSSQGGSFESITETPRNLGLTQGINVAAEAPTPGGETIFTPGSILTSSALTYKFIPTPANSN